MKIRTIFSTLLLLAGIGVQVDHLLQPGHRRNGPLTRQEFDSLPALQVLPGERFSAAPKPFRARNPFDLLTLPNWQTLPVGFPASAFQPHPLIGDILSRQQIDRMVRRLWLREIDKIMQQVKIPLDYDFAGISQKGDDTPWVNPAFSQ